MLTVGWHPALTNPAQHQGTEVIGLGGLLCSLATFARDRKGLNWPVIQEPDPGTWTFFLVHRHSGFQGQGEPPWLLTILSYFDSFPSF